ncbi:MAG: hypothetical protein M3444_06870 [Acidobacteriota bacterium]|nr:hypothetical protein [Acidobacteriota bacterium]MDQ5836457.1 hypothetical protein [Acidobacteriota bacterium]
MKTIPSAELTFRGRAAARSDRAAGLRLRGLASLVLLALINAGCATTPVPTDSASACPGNPAQFNPEFNSWFETGAVSLNGVVKPADSLNFPDQPNCSFYKWAEQMFLWLNSPAPSSYGGGERIFASPAFYDVSPPGQYYDAYGHLYGRILIPHAGGSSTTLQNMALRPAKPGPHGLPVIMGESGRMLEIQRPQFGPNGKTLILNERGEAVEVERIAMGGDKRPVFFDRNDREIPGAKPLIQEKLKEVKDLNRELIVQKFVVEQNPVFLDLNGNVVTAEQGQADGAVLMAQNGSLVYYQIMVNDVYAYYETFVSPGPFAGSDKFLTTAPLLNQLKSYAIGHGLPGPEPFPDPNALAVEIKTAWVEAAGLPDSSYITMNARIPIYNKVNSKLWQRANNYKVVKMALVGMHVVGSAAGHPEMIWATFEHEDNAPNAKYRYNSKSGLKTVNPDFSKAFLFCASNPPLGDLNKPHMIMNDNPTGNPDDIIGFGGWDISPSNTIRGNAWGAVFGVTPNPAPGINSDADSNSELISLNNSVRGMLDSADVRGKYILTGATWVINGADFTIDSPGSFGTGNTQIVDGMAVGTSQMANTTMETYQQALNTTTHQTTFNKAANNCFSCHEHSTTNVSHIFVDPITGLRLKPLF